MSEKITKLTVTVVVETTKRNDETELTLRENESIDDFQKRVQMEIDVLTERV